MKKVLLTIFFALIGIACYAQLFKSIKYYDKFDDEIKVEQRKTLITITDSSTIVIEEKGKKPVEYYILNVVESATKGSKEKPVNLVASVYGYEKTWCVVRKDMLEAYLEVNKKLYQDPSKENINKVQPFWLFIVHRTLTTQFTGSYLDELFWVQDAFLGIDKEWKYWETYEGHCPFVQRVYRKVGFYCSSEDLYIDADIDGKTEIYVNKDGNLAVRFRIGKINCMV